VKKKYASAARSKFQEFSIWRQKSNILGLASFSKYEQVKGEMALKFWETNLEYINKISIEAKETSLNTLSFVETKLVEF
jgi:hypothetical protein